MDGLGWFGVGMVDFVGFGGWFGRFGKVWGDVVCVLYVHQIRLFDLEFEAEIASDLEKGVESRRKFI